MAIDNREDLSLKRNQIIKIYGEDYREMTKQLLAAADLISRIPDKNCRIGIKPNLVAPTPAFLGATTHPEVVAGIIEYLQEYGCRNLTIAEGSWVGDCTSEAMEVCGYCELAEKYGVRLIDAQKEGSFEKDCGGLKLRLTECVKEFDFLINVPVVKGHCQTKITCALKNMKGLLPNAEKRHFHAMGLHRPIAHLALGIHQDFIVADHICGDLDFEDGGNPVVRNCIMAAADPVLLDAYVCNLLHYDCNEVPYIGMAEALGAGSADLKNVQVAVCERKERNCHAADMDLTEERTEAEKECTDSEADTAQISDGNCFCASSAEVLKSSSRTGKLSEKECDEGVQLHFLSGDAIWDEEIPYAQKVVAVRDVVEEVESCSACYGSLLPVLDRLKEEGLLGALQEKICIGQGYRGKSGQLGVGLCTSGFAYCIKGCPPSEEEIYEGLKRYLAEQR